MYVEYGCMDGCRYVLECLFIRSRLLSYCVVEGMS